MELFFWLLVIVIIAIIVGIYFSTSPNRKEVLRMKMKNLWNWLVNEGGRPFSSPTNERTGNMSEEQLNPSEIIQQINKIDAVLKDSVSSIKYTLVDIQNQQASMREELERVQQAYRSIYTQQEQQMAILRELKDSLQEKTDINQGREIETPSSTGNNRIRSFKELYCRQLNEEKKGFRVSDLTDSPNNNCYIIKQYDATRATLNIVDDPLVRSQMISGFTDFIAPVCDFDGQPPAGKNGFEVKETGELELYGEKWIIKKKLKIKFI